VDPNRVSFKTSVQIVCAKLLYSAAITPERYESWCAQRVHCAAPAKCSSSWGKHNPRVVKRRISYYPSRKGDEPLDVRLHTTIRVRFEAN